MIETQSALEYKITTDYARDEFGFSNKQLIDDVQRWNEQITYRKTIEKNIWVGIFYPNIVDKYNLHKIELN